MMTEPSLLILWGAVAGFGLLLALVGLRSSRSVGMRAVVIGLVVALGVTTYGVGERVLGNARPVSFELLQPASEAQVLYAQAVRDEGIYLLIAGDPVPTYYRLPWDDETARELREALERSLEKQTPLMFRFEPSLDEREPKFYAMPQPSQPDKPAPEQGLEYRNPGWSI